MDNGLKLFKAAHAHDLPILRELEKDNCIFQATNSKGKNALHFAVQTTSNNVLAVVQFLLEKGVDPLSCDENFKTPFDIAEENKNPSLSIIKRYIINKEKENQSYLEK